MDVRPLQLAAIAIHRDNERVFEKEALQSQLPKGQIGRMVGTTRFELATSPTPILELTYKHSSSPEAG
jgi:hypothetical protein